MAKKTAATKKKQPAAKPRTVAAKGKLTSAAITFRLTPAEVKQAKACLAKSGEIRYTFKDIRVTKLPQVLDDGKQID